MRDLVVEHVASGGSTVRAVSGVSFDLDRGETLGLVGESGCGKSSTGRALMMLPSPTSGSVRFDGQELTSLGREDLRRVRRQLQIIAQDPVSSLNPRRRVRQIVAEGAVIWRDTHQVEARVDEMLEAVGLSPAQVGDRRPHEFSGGQCQRIAIARALMLRPRLLVCDEAVSALDVSVQAQIINLLKDTRSAFDLTMVFIAHDLAVVKNISDRIAVMYLGKLVEIAPAASLDRHPAHPYTEALVEAVPRPDPAAIVAPMRLTGEVPSALNPPSGCRFRTRCPRAESMCAQEEPPLHEVSLGHLVACHFPNRVP